MPSNNRSAIFATAGAIGALTFVAFGAGFYAGALPKLDGYAVAANYMGQHPLPTSEIGKGVSPPVSEADTTTIYQLHYDREDLKAQWVMAWWTQIMGITAVVGAFLAAVSILLIWRTWDATRRAAASSEKTHEAFVAIERARLIPAIKMDFEGEERTFGIEVKATNIGRSSCVVERVYLLWGDTDAFPDFEDNPPYDVHIHVEAGQDKKVFDSWGNIRTLPKQRFYKGIIEYRSLLGHHHRSHFCIEHLMIVVGKGSSSQTVIRQFSRVPNTWPADS